MPAKASCFAGLISPVTMPMTWPSRFSSGPPELPGFTAASNWIKPSIFTSLPVGLNVRSNPEMTPALIEPARPSG